MQAPLPFVGGGSSPVQYEIQLDATHWFVHYRHGRLEVYANSQGPVEFLESEVRLRVQLAEQLDGHWGARETNVYLTLISDSIRANHFDPSSYSSKQNVHEHPAFRLGPLPLYRVGLDSGAPPATQFGLVPAQDVASWVEVHPAEHDAFKREYPLWWARISQDLQR